MATNIVTANVTIRGTRPFWCHHFGPDALGDGTGTRKAKEGSAGNNPNEWRKTVLVTNDGQLYVEPTYIFGTLRNAAKFTKKGRLGSIQSDLSATLQVVDSRVLIDRYFLDFPNGHPFDIATVATPDTDVTLPLYLDIRGVRNPSTGARNVRYRVAASPGWQCSFSITWDQTIVAVAQMEAVHNDAANLVGLGNGRSIGMGRFEVVSFDLAA